MSDQSVILSAFADEGANYKSAVEQLATISAIGLKWYSPRFVDVAGSGEIKHVTQLNEQELSRLNELHNEYGVRVTSIGSKIGKVKLHDIDDGSHNTYVKPEEYIRTEVAGTIRTAKALGTKMIRGFSFYHPQTESAEKYLDEAASRIKEIVQVCAEEGLIYGLEVEANLVGQNGNMMAELARRVDHPSMLCIFDGGNLSSQNMPPERCYKEYEAMRPYMGWAHIKDYKIDPGLTWEGVVDEERLKNFVPAHLGDSAHAEILKDLATRLPELNAKVKAIGMDGFFLELEPHLKGGGQFGGFSGPDGLGVALRSLSSMLDEVGIEYHLRDFEDIKTARGF